MEVVDENYPLQLSNGRITRHFHTRTKTGRTPQLQSRDREPWLQISEEDAKTYDLSEGDFALVESRRGEVELRTRIGDIEKGRVFIPFHFGYFDGTDGRARAANELTQGKWYFSRFSHFFSWASTKLSPEQWDPVSKQPLFKSGTVRVTKLAKPSLDGTHLSAPEQQTVAIHQVETNEKVLPSKKEKRFLEAYLGATQQSLITLATICADLIPGLTHDHEVSLGMRVMHRLLNNCVEALQPHADKYAADVDFGKEISKMLQRHLFPPVSLAGGISGSGVFDCLLALQSLYSFIGHIESHLIVLDPTSKASWDTGFTEAVGFVKEQIERVKTWTVQQLGTRGPQALLVPCKEATGLKSRVEKDLSRW
jgi:ferredoxin-nitrate reductase